MNEFEQRLGRVPGKPVPADWRAEILGVARAAGTGDKLSPPRRSFRAYWHDLLWPYPKGWAGLAAAWLVILALHFSMVDRSPGKVSLAATQDSAPPSSEMRAELRRERQQLLTELMGPKEASEADRARMKPQPRTELARILMT